MVKEAATCKSFGNIIATMSVYPEYSLIASVVELITPSPVKAKTSEAPASVLTTFSTPVAIPS